MQRKNILEQTIKDRTKLNWKDFIFIIAINITPFLTSTGLLSIFLTRLGPNSISTILMIPLLVASFGASINSFRKNFFFTLTSLTTCYVVYKFGDTSMQQGMLDTFLNFRYSFMNILPFFIACFYIRTLDKEKTYKIIKVFIYLTLFQAIFFIGHAIGFFNFYSGLVTEIEGSNLQRIYVGYPPMLIFSYAIVFMQYILYRKIQSIYLLGIFITTVFLSYTRSSLAELIIVSLILLVFSFLKSVIKISLVFKFCLTLTLFSFALYLLFPSSFNYWVSKMDNTLNYELKEKQGTYAFRERLIEEAIYQTKQANRKLTGIGYKRDSKKGEYSIVQGGDTLIAPVLYCEGILGMLLRVSIVLIILLQSVKIYISFKNKWNISVAIIISSVILAQIPNYIQTTIYTQFTVTILPLIMLTNLYQMKKNENSTNI